MFSELKTLIQTQLIGHECFVVNDLDKLVSCKITRVDLYVSKSGIKAAVHLKRAGLQNFPHYVNLYIPGEIDQLVSPGSGWGYLSEADYQNYKYTF